MIVLNDEIIKKLKKIHSFSIFQIIILLLELLKNDTYIEIEYKHTQNRKKIKLINKTEVCVVNFFNIK